MAHVTLTLAQLKTLATFSGVTVQVCYTLTPVGGRVDHVAFFNNGGLSLAFYLHPKPTEADFKGALNFPTALQVEAIE